MTAFLRIVIDRYQHSTPERTFPMSCMELRHHCQHGYTAYTPNPVATTAKGGVKEMVEVSRLIKHNPVVIKDPRETHSSRSTSDKAESGIPKNQILVGADPVEMETLLTDLREEKDQILEAEVAIQEDGRKERHLEKVILHIDDQVEAALQDLQVRWRRWSKRRSRQRRKRKRVEQFTTSSVWEAIPTIKAELKQDDLPSGMEITLQL
ncbi:hypothetical protein Hypma_006951 [Hypsizygus marmoreus]|uniref:Uncharacterized protein n=1 Tax=Hypsizygus marmoreus TaxID=39966 RepID=A0A369K050_HYPMA|nr:hypothetical protein Hypma_006951 [Hypsizygus marmoreus]